MKTKTFKVLVLTVALALVACTTAQIITTVTMLVQVLENELPVILPYLVKLPAPQQAVVTGYLNAASDCADFIATETAGTDDPAMKVTKIIGSCSSVRPMKRSSPICCGGK